MEIKLEKAVVDDANSIFPIQREAFLPLLEKYKDYHTNPAAESIDRVIKRISDPSGGFFKIVADNELVGAICVTSKDNLQYWISPMFILPAFQGRGIAQKSITLVEQLFTKARTWELATILEEKRNGHLYEKMGYQKTGIIRKLNEQTTLIYYRKKTY
ncbi:GNAT family N-acetyltransferase [Gracilibacillus salinarum]|uniref:GNAT family N-acetyltransferase n=1 Tax=Gracilibacillus salinarum TaxID=2932255 RepID=A0ABY4GSQ2_9BACI|nr:GNAT family N-acetyltransferase [Gracilibacillus salinarum]UOQ87168.1 GNAT family N-acetyltransferase [Gracilibacillus salinarum]